MNISDERVVKYSREVVIMRSIEVVKLIFEDVDIARRDVGKIRGYFAAQFPQYDELHNHSGNQIIYRYPLIQYKVLNGEPVILGINIGSKVLKAIVDELNLLHLGDEIIFSHERTIKEYEAYLGISKEYITYQFETPWLALNAKNYRRFKEASNGERDILLRRILIGNILSLSKAFDYVVNDRIDCSLNLKTKTVNYKNQKMLAFDGTFTVNFIIPEEFGIGKSVSKGFGTVRRLNYD